MRRVLTVVLAASLLAVADPAASAAPGLVYMSGFGGTLFAIETPLGSRTTISTGGSFSRPIDLEFSPTGELYMSDESALGGGGALFRIDPDLGTQTLVSSGGQFLEPNGIAFGPNGELYVGDARSDMILRVDPALGAQTVVATDPVFGDGGGFEFLTLDAAPGGLVVASAGQSAVAHVDVTTGAVSVLASGGLLRAPTGIVRAADGTIYVTDSAPGGCSGAPPCVMSLDPATHTPSIVASGPPMASPFDIEIGPDGKLYVADFSAGTLFAIDPSTGAITTVTSLPVASAVGVAFRPTPSNGPNPPVANGPPTFSTDSKCGSVLSVPSFGETRINFSATDPQSAQSVTLTSGNLPTWASFTSTPGNPATGVLRASPSVWDWLLGLFVPAPTVTVTATDNAPRPLSTTCAVTLRSALFTSGN